ncbi:unnamed protein product [Paramecium sonneborni]|uniref:Uncharacterized protein n=1 Tax=Paramecium sonneborni TaxID=65129 RepID=A0A8S1PW22_9CILI|nr:unnamed protein product [Paramecium sonneborni]CAD8107462.1 unnamed protein product [Paramecium sonneborni]
MNNNNLNSFKQYQTFSTYQSRTILPENNLQSIKLQEYTRPEIQRINLKIDQMLDTLNQYTPSLMNHQKQQQESNFNNNSQLETQLPPSQYNSFIGKQQIPQSQQQQYQSLNFQPRYQSLQYSLTPQQTQFQYNTNLKQEFDEYTQFKDFIKAKKLVLNTNAPLSDLYKYYLENDVYSKTQYYRFQEDKVNKIILQK